MKTREEVEKEAKDLNRWRKTLQQATKCDHCGGRGRQYAPVYGDPVMGYEDNGPCTWCKGTGKDKTKLCI